jgi:predicted Zn-dependent peptidase
MTADTIVVAERPRPGTPRGYEFPAFARDRLSNGLTVITVDVPGRPLVSALLLVRHGAVDEPSDVAGATILAARALTEGTEAHDAIGLIEAAERLGASIHADASWDALTIGVDVPASRLEPALALVAEVATTPTFPASDVARLRDERLNDILQARADPRRRVEEAFIDTIYDAASPYHRPSGGTRETVERLDVPILRETYERAADPSAATLIVAGEIGTLDVPAIAERLLGGWSRTSRAAVETLAPDEPIHAQPATRTRRVRVVDRPGSVQSEVRIGHIGRSRRIPDFHPLSVMSAVLGGLFNSRLNMKLREEKGYTYGASASFDLRRGAGPFAARAAVQTPVTVPAIVDTLAELERIREAPVSASELAAARDFLVGVFPLRFETPGPIVGAIAGLVVHGLPDDELAHYRDRMDAVTVDEVLTTARSNVRPAEAQIVVVGDADAIVPELEAASLGEVMVDRDAPSPAPASEDEPASA